MSGRKIQNDETRAFYAEALQLLNECGAPYMLGGAFALFQYTGLYRDTKDLDIFLKHADFPKVMQFFAKKGFTTELHDVRWIAKIFKGEYFIDLIFNSVNNICTVDDSWFEHATNAEFCGAKLKVLPPEELIWCKSYVWNRERFDGADINHVILKQGRNLDWRRLLNRMDPHWHILLAELIMFQFVYPYDYHDIIPKWLFDELMMRANEQYKMPFPAERVCRGTIIDNTQYASDIKDDNYKSMTIMTI